VSSIKAVNMQKLNSGTRSAENIFNTYSEDRGRTLFAYNFSYGTSEATDNIVFFGSNNSTGLFCTFLDQLTLSTIISLSIGLMVAIFTTLADMPSAFKFSAAMRASFTIRPVAIMVTSVPSTSTLPLPISKL